MKKILLIIAIIFLIFQMVVLATDIDVGSPALNRDYASNPNYTFVDANNPANVSGTITSIEIWANQELENCEVAIFYVVSGDNLSTRAGGTVNLGTVTVGEHSISNGNPITTDFESNPFSLTVETGDFIGIHFTAGGIESDIGATKSYLKSGDYIPSTNQGFTSTSDYYSLYGTGELPTYNYFGYNSS